MTLLQFFLLIQVAAAVQVVTKNGRLKGEYIRNQLGNDYYIFSGIPYAKPMSANSTSKDPEPIGNWSGVRDATIGWQSSNRTNSTNQERGNEDCLYLTVYTKKIRKWLPPTMVQTYHSSPVEVYFIGCTIGPGGNGTRPELNDILREDVVKVLVNHRLRTSDPNTSGADLSTTDQSLALEWIKSNILYFGGDPQRVAVLGGHSALAGIDINQLSGPEGRVSS